MPRSRSVHDGARIDQVHDGKRHLSTRLDAENSLRGESLLSLVLQSVGEMPRKKFFDPIDRMIGDMFEDVGKIRFWVQAN